MAGLVFTIDGKDMPSQDALNLLSHKDRGTRQKAAAEISRVLGDNIKLFSLITNTLIRDKQTEDEWRNIERHSGGGLQPLNRRQRILRLSGASTECCDQCQIGAFNCHPV